jgi:hypothetical protein
MEIETKRQLDYASSCLSGGPDGFELALCRKNARLRVLKVHIRCLASRST